MRERGAFLAACQRLPLAACGSISIQKGPNDKIGAAISSCPWLETSTDVGGGMPYFLWDIKHRRTIPTSTLVREVEHIAISHTWGRWRKDTAAQVEGVPLWTIPENKKFDVKKLPETLAQIPLPTDYIWFDLV